MSKDVKGVFVRLPLSDAQVLALLDAYTGDKKTTNQKMEDALLAIGTTVAGGELEAVGYITNNRPFGTNTLTHWILYKHRQHDQEYGVVRQSDAQSALAAAQAEIAEEQRISNLRADAVERWTNTCAQQDEVIAGLQAENMRLREHLETVRSYLKEAPSVTARRGALDVIEEALKGPAA